MVIIRNDLDRLADDQYQDRRITTSTYCGNCGYNLRTLPYIYTCPECGHEYNARPLVRRGIFDPSEAEIPWWHMAGVVFFFWGTFSLGYHTFNSLRNPFTMLFLFPTLVFLLVMTGCAMILSVRAYRRLTHFYRTARLTRKIAEQEGEDD